jgi:phage/plasmid-associated DNA primase
MTNYVLTERIPVDRALYISEMVYADFRKYCTRCENEDERHKMYNKLKRICNDIAINNGSMTREYKYSESMENYGRLSSNGLQGVMREFRGFLMGGTTTDIDQENSHPVILSYLCKKNNIKCDAVDEYNRDREKVLESFFPMTRSDAKCELLKCINRDQHNKNQKKLFYKKWDREIQRIQTEILALPEFKVIFDTVPVDKVYNKIGSKMSRILCHHENLILQVALETIQQENIEVATLMADGCMIYGNYYEDSGLLEKIKTACNAEFDGLNMNWTYKPHCQDIVIPEGWQSKKMMKAIKADTKNEIKEKKNDVKYSDYLPYSLDTDVGVVKFIIKHFPDKFIWIKDKEEKSGIMYSWTGKRWETGNLEFIRFISGKEVSKILYSIIDKAKNDLTVLDPKLLSSITETVYSALKSFETRAKQLKYVDTTEAFLTNELIKFDNNPDIIGFNNGIYDLIKHEFREVRYSDYITLSCGYDYNPVVDPIKTKEMENLLATIIPDLETRNLMIEVMSAGLTGRVIEKFVVFNGGGRNGKGLLDEFLKIIYGDYGHIYANVSLLTEKDKTGGNPEKATIHNKRIVIMKEPDENEPLLNCNIKNLTGGGNVSGRMLYSNSSIIQLAMILIMECNEKPKLKSEPKDAEEDRFVDILFPNRFTTIEEEIDNVTVFKGNSNYKTIEWKESHRDAFLQILIQSFKVLQSNNYVLTIPSVVALRTKDYLNKSFPIVQLFNDHYEKSTDVKDILKLKDVYNHIKSTNTFMEFSKDLKRKYNYKFFVEFVMKNHSFKQSFKDSYGIFTNVLVGFKTRVNENDIVDTI